MRKQEGLSHKPTVRSYNAQAAIPAWQVAGPSCRSTLRFQTPAPCWDWLLSTDDQRCSQSDTNQYRCRSLHVPFPLSQGSFPGSVPSILQHLEQSAVHKRMLQGAWLVSGRAASSTHLAQCHMALHNHNPFSAPRS